MGASMAVGGDVAEGSGRADLPVDVRRRVGGEASDAAVVEAMLDALPSPTVLLDPDGTVVMGNRAWTAAGEEHGQHIDIAADYYADALLLCDDADARTLVHALRELAAGLRSEVSIDRSLPSPAGAGLLWFHVQARRVDEAGHVVVTHTDVTSRVRAEQAAHWRARADHLTELPNPPPPHELIDADVRGPHPRPRSGVFLAIDGFKDVNNPPRPQAGVAVRRSDRRPVSVLFLDIDGFKDVNDSLGHEVGDELLRQLADRLVTLTRGQDTVGRLGGDEFVVLCRDCDSDGAEALAQRFRCTFQEPFDLGVRTTRLTTSIGIATARAGDPPSTRSTDLVRDADLAMYAAKSSGRDGIRVFSPDLRHAVQRKVQVAAELCEAIAGNQLVLHYQP